MAIKHLRDGENFGDSADHFPASFGFRGDGPAMPNPSTKDGADVAPPPESDFITYPADFGFTGSNSDVKPVKMAKGKGKPEVQMAEGGHITHHKDGSITHHHAHGGKTIVHADGRVERHHAEGGHTMHFPDGRTEFHDSSEYVHRAKGGAMMNDEMQDKAMVRSGVHQHEAHLHRGQPETDMHLARGGAVGMRPRVPRSMKPKAEGLHTPINTAPRDPKFSRSMPNAMPGGVEAYGVQPSDEPDSAGTTQGIPQLRRGGTVRG